MKLLIGAHRLLTSEGWKNGCVLEIEDGRISRIASGTVCDHRAEIISPGLFDPHIHGGNGFDIMEPTVEGMEAWLLELAKAGVTAVLPSPYTAPMETMRNSLSVLSQVMERQARGESGGAQVLGAHLEGPFISKNRLGAMEERFVPEPSAKTCRQLLEGYEGMVKEMTFAPEVPGSEEVLGVLKEHGIRAQAGHCDATFEEGEAAFEKGVGSVCHFFNAARPIHHRDPGFLSAALVNPEIYCEMIGDLVHLHPGAIRLIWQCKAPEKIMLISDAVSTTNLPDGVYVDNGLTVEVRNGASFAQGGGLTGGGTYLPGAVRNLVSLGISEENALRAASVTAAAWLGLPHGIQEGGKASLTAWGPDLTAAFTVIGNEVYQKEGSACTP